MYFSTCSWHLFKRGREKNKHFYHLYINKDTVPPRKEDFVAHHFSHNAPHRPYIHCVDQGERKEKEREEAEISVRHRKPSGREQSSDKKLAGQRRIINQRERVTQR